MSAVAPADPDREEPDAAPRESRLRRWQMYVGLAVALGVTVAWVCLLVVFVSRMVGLAVGLAF